MKMCVNASDVLLKLLALVFKSLVSMVFPVAVLVPISLRFPCLQRAVPNCCTFPQQTVCSALVLRSRWWVRGTTGLVKPDVLAAKSQVLYSRSDPRSWWSSLRRTRKPFLPQLVKARLRDKGQLEEHRLQSVLARPISSRFVSSVQFQR